MKRIIKKLQLVSLVLACANMGAYAQTRSSLESFYAGKTIDLIVGSRAGGGYSTYALLLARHFGRYMPGNPTVVAKNMDGAGSLIAAGFMYNRAPRDGTAFAALFMGAIMEPLIGDATNARFDPRKFSFVGSANRETSVCVAWHTSPIQSFKDMFEKEMIIGTSGITSSIRQYPAVLNNVLGTKFKMIMGYPGSNDAALAMEKGETQGLCGIQWSSFNTSHQHWLEKNQVRIIAQISSPEGDPELNRRGVTKIWDFVKTESDRQTLNVVFSQLEFGRPYVLPPEVPKDRVEAYRVAFDATMKAPAFLEEAKKLQIDIDPVTGAAVQKLVDEIYATPACSGRTCKSGIEVMRSDGNIQRCPLAVEAESNQVSCRIYISRFLKD